MPRIEVEPTTEDYLDIAKNARAIVTSWERTPEVEQNGIVASVTPTAGSDENFTVEERRIAAEVIAIFRQGGFQTGMAGIALGMGIAALQLERAGSGVDLDPEVELELTLRAEGLIEELVDDKTVGNATRVQFLLANAMLELGKNYTTPFISERATNMGFGIPEKG